MSTEQVLDVITQALMVVINVSMPPLIMGLTVGILVSIFQAVTSIQEPTLAFVPKILAVLFALIFFGTYMESLITQLFVELYSQIPYYIAPK